MEKEYFLSGYCRTTDASRMVTLVTVDGALDEVDCCYPNCTYAPNCEIAKKIRECITPCGQCPQTIRA